MQKTITKYDKVLKGLKNYIKELLLFQTKDKVIIVLGLSQWAAIITLIYSIFFI